MVGPLLETKLHVPRRRRGLVARPRLLERLDRGTEAALTLVSAPAGFGKTTVLTDWLTSVAAGQRPVAWLSLDQRDNDPAVFWTYLVAALRTAAPGVGAGALALLQSPRASTEAVLATLVNDLSASPDDVVLVLDDYHVVDAPEVQDGMSFLVEHLPAQVHLVIAGRADPALPLARWRARGDLVELRAADLRFTADEAAAYLDVATGLTLTTADVAALEQRTEGWIAALQLAALSMQGRDDVAGFIAGFAGDDRYVVDYLVEEVLARQPERVRSFLLQTSVLSRLTGPLCDALTGRNDGKAMLEALDRANLFLVPLDGRRRWYRYHHLFADVLHVRLQDELPDAVSGLHRQAAEWYERSGDRAEAVHHALAGGDVARAADLVELALPALQKGRQEATMRRWLEALPDEVIRVRPVLGVGHAAALMVSGRVEGVEARLRDAERWLSPTPDGAEEPPAPPTEMVVADEAGFRRLPSAIAMYRAGQALLSGDVAGTVAHARRALDLAGAEDHLGRGGAAGLLGLAHWASGDLGTAHRWYSDAASCLEEAGHVSDVAGCAIALADICLARARLGEARSTYERALRLVTPDAGPVLRGAADVHVGIAGILTERGDLDAARRHLLVSRDLGEHVGLPQNPYRWRVVMARIREAEGDVAAALGLLEEAERRYVGDYFPEVRPLPALRAQVLARRGRWAEALAWAQERGLSVDDDPDYLREFEHLTFARALAARSAAQGDARPVSGAVHLLARLLQAAEEGCRTGSVIAVLVVQALAEQTRGDVPAALAALRRALALAEPQGYVRVFADEGAAIGALLRAVAAEDAAAGYAHRLVAALGTGEDDVPAPAGLVDPLSARELDVLRMLGSDLDGPDIARRLFVSVNTVRTHTKNIYAKLGVTNRRAAVRRGEDLDLVPRPRDRPDRAAVPDR
ncbi:LuxR family transcriptional regulator, maltose regulon positive regulatory protein [Geodermatophilus saharensis]|uniref:LuxR family transcriptional regulator, maltose regulon positive regulatory protein n=1 Tax=Geodermatophilus saharensis TaxID=1137994 RepID=A0A239C2H7_9ACTN|nr:LuxR C-terminal-related transcriptional regulator [Geodermatophilus saharensis]SNS14505.1 LuxR family transcriptional regulator, maltose regulon positive regulatory protein [Geodermatophilus saharensis]